MKFNNNKEIKDFIDTVLNIQTDGQIAVLNKTAYVNDKIDRLVYNAVFNEDKGLRDISRWIIRESASVLGVISSSIQGLYDSMGRGKCSGFSVPAINIRGITYDVARAIFRAALKGNVGAFIFEIAKSELDYTHQRPSEYSSVILAAGTREGFAGPVFIQGDHFQVNADKYSKDSDGEFGTVRELIKEAIDADFFNIDIDTSTLVQLDKDGVVEQQRLNFELAAKYTELIRKHQPDGIMVSIGGEIGEVGGKNSDENELRVFMDNYLKIIKSKKIKGISKISVQTGTSHGGIPLPDGSIADVKLDFGTLEKLSKIAKEDYGIAGAVQHGASTLPENAFDRFPQTGTAEVHLATEFQNMIYENELFPKDLKKKIYEHLNKTCAKEKKDDQTEEQFIYKTRKKGFGPFKKQMWDLPCNVRDNISAALEAKFTFLFEKLNAVNTKDIVKKTVKPVKVKRNAPNCIRDMWIGEIQ